MITTLITFLCCYQIAFASLIVWDESHIPINNYGLNGQYSSLRDQLTQDGFDVEINEDMITVNSLWNADILIISILSNYESAYTTSEIERITSFVAGGGGLIIFADNSQVRPQNLSALVEQFEMSIATGDNIGNLTVFSEHAITQGLEEITFANGSALRIGDVGSILSTDENELGGLAINEEMVGIVVLLGDADAWTNQFLGDSDNLALVLNSVRYLDRQREGRIDIEVEWQQSILIEGSSDELEMLMYNGGNGLLETGISVPDNSDWISVSPQYAQINAGENMSIAITITTAGLEIGEDINTTLTVYHNQPDTDPLEIDFQIHVISDQINHFNVAEPTGIDHSMLISSLTIEGLDTHPGIEIGAFSEDGLCVGGVIYMGGQVGLAARGNDPFSDEIDGFINGERMHFKLFTLWDEVELETTFEIVEGEDRYNADGFTILTLDGRSGSAITLDFDQRWNLISLNVRPPSVDFQDIFAPMIDGGVLRMIKDGNGHFWNIERDFSNLGDWDVTQGYYVKVSQFTELEVTGVGIDVDIPIVLSFGWSIIPFLPTNEMPIGDAVRSIEDRLIIAKRDDGAFYIPEWDWNGIGNLIPSEGYQVKLSGLDTLLFPEVDEENNAFYISPPKSNPSLSGIDMSVLLLGLKPLSSIIVMDQNNVQVGFGDSDAAGRAGISVWGDDQYTDEDEGLSDGEIFYVLSVDKAGSKTVSIEWLTGADSFSSDGIAVGQMRSKWLLPSPQTISVTPNPFNSVVTIRYNSTGLEQIYITLYDVRGRRLMQETAPAHGKVNGQTISFSASGLPAGVILIKFQQGARIFTTKTVHLP